LEVRIKAVLTAPQPQTSWSRAGWTPLIRDLGANALRDAAIDEVRPVAERVRAIECLTELHPGVVPQVAALLKKAGSPQVRARAAWALGRVRPGEPAAVLAELAADKDPLVRRVALEAMTSITSAGALQTQQAAIAAGLSAAERPVRRAAALVVSRLSPAGRSAVRAAVSQDPLATVWCDIGIQMRSPSASIPAATSATALLVDSRSKADDRRDALRGLQLALGDTGPAKNRPPMFDGYAPRLSLDNLERELNPLLAQVSSMFPSGDAELDHELIRLFAMTSSLNRDVFSSLLSRMTADSHPSDDLHCLAALSRMPLERSYEESVRTAAALVGIDVKIRSKGLKQDTNWDDRIGELYTALVAVDPAMPSVLVDQPGFGLPGHVLFLSQVPADAVPRAVDGFVKAIAADPDYPWSNDVVFAIGESDRPEHEQLLRGQLGNLAVRDAILMVLAENPRREDRPLFLSGLDSAQLNAVEACAAALTRLPRSNDAAEQFQLLSAARRLVNDTREYTIRETVMRLLQNNTGQAIPFQFGTAGHKPQPESLTAWQAWLQQRYPDHKVATANEAAETILAGLAGVPWSQGDAERGRKLFDRLACARCHGGRRSLGPDLIGVARRFSRDDLFAAIVDPNRDISSRYQTTAIETTAGTVLTGLIVYESVDGLLLRDAEHRTYRLEEADIESRHQQRNSLMPGGLLKDATPADLADLYKYLQSL
jgi:putative heme-binding domain-containing protein